jgi:hypothetical protein
MKAKVSNDLTVGFGNKAASPDNSYRLSSAAELSDHVDTANDVAV